ncbi:hypothetical protein FPD38_05060 [Campylobacter volucris]|uniref:Pentapeptide repeat-containing protein n=2 Tax=Campylobacter volucris TaxID=1031542 RepID=A0A5C7E1V7_9BACT|nr:hypothetical protein FPD38_05060 [Campylobacter volucris]
MIFKENLAFDNVERLDLTIEDNVEIDMLHINNCNELTLKFNGKVKVINKISINGCKKIKQISINNHIDGNIEFQKCEFDEFNLCDYAKPTIYGNFIFAFCNIKKVADFMNFDFKNRVSFKMSKFKDNVYFNNSHFKDYVDFHECEFEKTACFYGVTFDKAPNFSQVIFKGNLNAVNTNLNFTFKNLENKITQECEDFNKGKNEQDKKSLDKFANDFRDSFRTFKSALIKDNNALDASNFHKYELYCKEIELKQNWYKKGIEPQNQQDLEKNTWRVKELSDFLLLGFYRKLCDHHTDFLRVFNNFVLLIALYALFVFGFTWLHYDKLEDTRAILTLYGFLDNFKSCIDGVIALFMILGCVFTLHKIDKNNYFEINFCNFLRYTKNKLLKGFKIVICDIQLLLESMFFALFFTSVFYIFLGGFAEKFLNLGNDFKYSLSINILFVSLYVSLICTKSLICKHIIIIISYAIVLITIINKPSIIHPLIGKIIDDAEKLYYPSLIVLNIFYTILIGLILFSLQKTARKNSIVPS